MNFTLETKLQYVNKYNFLWTLHQKYVTCNDVFLEGSQMKRLPEEFWSQLTLTEC